MIEKFQFFGVKCSVGSENIIDSSGHNSHHKSENRLFLENVLY